MPGYDAIQTLCSTAAKSSCAASSIGSRADDESAIAQVANLHEALIGTYRAAVKRTAHGAGEKS